MIGIFKQRAYHIVEVQRIDKIEKLQVLLVAVLVLGCARCNIASPAVEWSCYLSPDIQRKSSYVSHTRTCSVKSSGKCGHICRDHFVPLAKEQKKVNYTQKEPTCVQVTSALPHVTSHKHKSFPVTLGLTGSANLEQSKISISSSWSSKWQSSKYLLPSDWPASKQFPLYWGSRGR